MRPLRLLLLVTAAVLVVAAAYVVIRVTPSDDPAGTEPPIPSPTATDTSSASSSPSPSSSAPSTQPTEPAPTTVSPCPPGPARDLTVLSFNIHGGLGHDGYDLDRIVREVERWRADVVLLQEVDRYRERTELDDQPLELATRLDMFPAFGSNVRRPPVEDDGQGQEYGTLTLSRYPILDSENVRLPNEPGLEQRGLLRTTLDVEGAPVDVYNTHLQHTSGSIRRVQVRAIKEVLRRRDLPTIVGGDLNAEPDSPALRLFTGWRLRDPWPAVGVDDGLTVPAAEPQRRIDFVLHDDAFTPVAGEHLTSAVSDHRAVRIVLELTSPRDCGLVGEDAG